MPEYAATDKMYLDPLDGFTDREKILALFEHCLRSAQPGQLRVLAIKGNSGTGKTFLAEYLSKRMSLLPGWKTGQLSFFQSQPDFRTILTGLEDTLKRCVARTNLNQYREKRDAYTRNFDEYTSSYQFAFSRTNIERSLAVAACLPRLRLNIAHLNAN